MVHHHHHTKATSKGHHHRAVHFLLSQKQIQHDLAAINHKVIQPLEHKVIAPIYKDIVKPTLELPTKALDTARDVLKGPNSLILGFMAVAAYVVLSRR